MPKKSFKPGLGYKFMKESFEFDNEEFRIHESMVKDQWIFSWLSLLLLPLWFPLLAIMALLSLIFGKRFSAPIAAKLVPKVMADVD